MKLSRLHERLIATARAPPPGDQVPYAFEKRIMARLTSRPALNPWAFWERSLWRAAIPCLAIALLCGLWSHLPAQREADTLSQDFESAVYAGLNQHAEDSW